MTLPVSGAMTLAQVQAEFSAPTSAKMSDLYRGGVYVPNHANTAGVPISGLLSLSDFYGASVEAPISASISDRLVAVTLVAPSVPTAGYRIDSDGNAYVVVNGSSTAISGEWLVAGSNTDFEVRATVQSGVNTSGASLNTWLATTADRTWSISSSSGVSVQSVILIEIRAGATVLDSATITLDAEQVI